MTRLDLEELRLIAVSTVTVPIGQPYAAFVPPMRAERPLVLMLLGFLTPVARRAPSRSER